MWKMQNYESWLTQWMTSLVELDLKHLRIAPTETSWSPIERNAKCCNRGRTTPCIPTSWKQTGRVTGLLKSIRRLQWMPDQMSWQRIVTVRQLSSVHIRRSMAGRFRKVIFPSAWHWSGCIWHTVQSGASPLQKDVKKLESVQQKATTMVSVLEHMISKGILRDLGLLRQVKANLIA